MVLDWTIQWSVAALSIFLLWRSFRKPGTTEWLLAFFITGWVSILLGVLAVEEGMLEYPVRFFPEHFASSILFELLAFPALSVMFNQTTRHSSFIGICGQALLYSSIMLFVELILEKHTNAITYTGWAWYHTLLSLFAVFMLVRGLLALVRRIAI